MSTARVPAAGRAINRRIFVQSVLTGIVACLTGGVAPKTQRERGGKGWKITTKHPDRLKL